MICALRLLSVRKPRFATFTVLRLYHHLRCRVLHRTLTKSLRTFDNHQQYLYLQHPSTFLCARIIVRTVYIVADVEHPVPSTRALASPAANSLLTLLSSNFAGHIPAYWGCFLSLATSSFCLLRLLFTNYLNWFVLPQQFHFGRTEDWTWCRLG